MEDDIIVNDNENNDLFEEPEEAQNEESSALNSEIIVFTPEDIDISTPFFTGVSISGVMCMLSLGIAMVVAIFRKA